MAMVQMNVRIDTGMKSEVDRVLKDQGVSVSDVVRSLWSYIADRGEIPNLETTAEERTRETQQEAKLKLARQSVGCIHQELVDAGAIHEDADLLDGMNASHLRDDMYDQRLRDYLNMKRAD
jgi:addiction module RelB/DinJ family antitoxin